LLCFRNYCQTNSENAISLITWEYSPKKGIISYYPKLVKYKFSDGRFIGKVILFEVGNVLPRYFDGGSIIYKNRYIISWSGDVFDLQKNRLIFDQIGYDFYVGIDGDSLIFKHARNYFNEDSVRYNKIKSLYYYFDLKNEKIVEITNCNKYQVKGVLSPNKEFGLDFKIINPVKHEVLDSVKHLFITHYFGQLFLHKSTNDSILLLDSLSVGISPFSSLGADLPIYWQNNNQFLTQKRNGLLIKVDLEGKVVNYFPELHDLKMELKHPEIKNIDGKLVYFCPTKQSISYEINLDRMSLVPYVFQDKVGYNFSRKFNEITNELSYCYNDSLIISGKNITSFTAVCENNIAINSLKNCKKEYWNCNSYITVFNSSLNKWTEIKTRYIADIIGWIKE